MFFSLRLPLGPGLVGFGLGPGIQGALELPAGITLALAYRLVLAHPVQLSLEAGRVGPRKVSKSQLLGPVSLQEGAQGLQPLHILCGGPALRLQGGNVRLGGGHLS